MAKPGKTRIEPAFEKSSSESIRIGEDDRVMPGQRKRPPATGARSGAERPRRKFSIGRIIYWGLVLVLWGVIGLAGLVVWYGSKLPSVADWSVPDRPPNVKLVSADGTLIANRGMSGSLSGGEAVSLKEMSPYLPKAVVAIEDRRFYSHFGVDVLGLGRAALQNLLGKRQGGSTLTQQLAKNLFLKPDRTLERKVQEMLLALWLEHEHSKDQILELYLNRVYFGSGAYGVEAASRRYFGKSARDVTLAEAALIAGLLKAPSALSPARDPEAAEARAQLVLAAMREEGMITEKELANAKNAPSARAPAFWTGSENYVADQVMAELPKLIGEVRSDIVVETTIDLKWQKAGETAIRSAIDKNRDSMNVSQGALVAIANDGAVRAMVGGYDYATSQFDRVTKAHRQPGSAFKPFVYLAALEQGKSPESVRNDAPVKIGTWTPENYNGKYYGRVSLATALAKSLNSVAAQLIMEVGVGSVVETAQRLGIDSVLQDNNSIALGTSEVTPLELTAAYVPFANGGYRPDLHFVERVTDTSGKVLYEHPDTRRKRVISPEVVGMMNAMMSETISDGTAKKAAFGWPAAGKTGTSQKSRDAWFVGYTGDLTTGVWFGNDDGDPMKKVTGGALPAAAWRQFMVVAHKGQPVVKLPGEWNMQPGLIDQNVPDMAVGEANLELENSIQNILNQSAPRTDDNRGRASETIEAPFPEAPPAPGEVPHPTPRVDVGGKANRETSIFDIIVNSEE